MITNKEEFVTCSGVLLKQVVFRNMESMLVPGLHFAGDCLDMMELAAVQLPGGLDERTTCRGSDGHNESLFQT
ncbi:NAD(P)/FAD-dependent oxidoreductase [Coraliomargarita sinensis]|uniref:NAD(P)/FAD-dependent oxidoreductase n=1 Tax=Coraliomargarita sinensis TaxID=2174842 RepID=UPI0018EE9999|nr:NAD(P)/FAD-dependent oxidoreductase [Coraliomargarita sinensis]